MAKHWRHLGVCVDCSVEALISYRGGRCEPCARKRYVDLRKTRFAAQYAVLKARRQGLLPALNGSIACVDCGEPAAHYDHRDYSKPLDVVPVCRSCNCRRGPGLRVADAA
jgi:hypothetical protein